MAILKCKMCGGDLSPKENEKVCECEFCGTRQTISTSTDEKVLKTISRGSLLRNNCEFDKARTLYEQLITDNLADAEVYWNIVLCKYGITYVDDYDGSKKPTINRMSNVLITDDDDFKKCIDLADVITRTQYSLEGDQIAKIQKEILDIANNEEPYDIFISYKETDEFGERTKDSLKAYEIYESLTKEGYRVFLSRVVLSSVAGHNYEPYIYSALYSAKAMILISSEEEFVNAVWVKNEWSRFLALMKKDKTKVLIPCYFDMDPYDLPKEIRNIQGLDMSKLGFIQDLMLGINKIFNKNNNRSQTTNTFDKEYTKKMMFLGEFDKAIIELDKAITNKSQDPEIYLFMLMAKNKIYDESFENIKKIKDFDKNSYFSVALSYSKDSLKDKLESFLSFNEKFIIENGILKEYIGDTNITKIVIPEGVIRIKSEWWPEEDDENMIEEVVLPISCKKIGNDAFIGFENLEKINLENVQEIGDWAFRDSPLKEVILGEHIKRIGEDVFYDEYIEKIILPNADFMCDGELAFYNLEHLKYAKMTIEFFIKYFHVLAKKAVIELYDNESIEKLDLSYEFKYCEYGELIIPECIKKMKIYTDYHFNIDKLTFKNKYATLNIVGNKLFEYIKKIDISSKSLAEAYKDNYDDEDKKRMLEQIIANGDSPTQFGIFDATKYGVQVPSGVNNKYNSNGGSSNFQKINFTPSNNASASNQLNSGLHNQGSSTNNTLNVQSSLNNNQNKARNRFAFLEAQRNNKYHFFGLIASIITLIASICIFFIKGSYIYEESYRSLKIGNIFLLSLSIVTSIYYFITLRNGRDSIKTVTIVSAFLGNINIGYFAFVMSLATNSAAFWLAIVLLSASTLLYLSILVHALIKKIKYW